MRRQGTVAALRKALRLHAEGMVKTCAVVFPGKGCREFYELYLAELLAQLHKQGIPNFDGSLRHGIGVFQNQFLRFREQPTGSVAG